MTKYQRKRYPDNWEALATACKERAGWQCERCGVAQYSIQESRQGKPYMVYLAACHINHDKHNPNPELQALCVRCHGYLDHQWRMREARIALERLKHQLALIADREFMFLGG